MSQLTLDLVVWNFYYFPTFSGSGEKLVGGGFIHRVWLGIADWIIKLSGTYNRRQQILPPYFMSGRTDKPCRLSCPSSAVWTEPISSSHKSLSFPVLAWDVLLMSISYKIHYAFQSAALRGGCGRMEIMDGSGSKEQGRTFSLHSVIDYVHVCCVHVISPTQHTAEWTLSPQV